MSRNLRNDPGIDPLLADYMERRGQQPRAAERRPMARTVRNTVLDDAPQHQPPRAARIAAMSTNSDSDPAAFAEARALAATIRREERELAAEGITPEMVAQWHAMGANVEKMIGMVRQQRLTGVRR